MLFGDHTNFNWSVWAALCVVVFADIEEKIECLKRSLSSSFVFCNLENNIFRANLDLAAIVALCCSQNE